LYDYQFKDFAVENRLPHFEAQNIYGTIESFATRSLVSIDTEVPMAWSIPTSSWWV
jgi:hypothetical protein